MDALDIITDLDNVIPFFQPIFSADEHRVIGYEILGRYRGKTEIESLGPFFLMIKYLTNIDLKWIIRF